MRCVVAAIAVLVVAGCTTGSDGDRSGSAGSESWTVVTPPDIEPVALTSVGDTVLVGGASQRQQPRLSVRRNGSWEPIPVTPTTGYGAKATLLYVAADGDGRLVAIGTATGGAHLNPRWTAWIGSVDGGIVEEPQTMETFGGPEAGGITGVVAGADPLVVGTWTLPAGGLGVATWRHSGALWQRAPSAPSLSGTGNSQTTATAAAATSSGTVIVGLETSLPGGTLHQRAVAWLRQRNDPDWLRIDLDASDNDSAATDVGCVADGCVIVGRLGDRLAAWRLDGTDVTGLAGVPARTIDRYAGQPRVAVGGSPVRTAIAVAATGGSSSVLVSTPDGSAAGWRMIDAPAGEVRRVTLAGDAIQLLLRAPDARQAVYSSMR